MKRLVLHLIASTSLAFGAIAGAPTLRAEAVEMVRSMNDFNDPSGWADGAEPSPEKDYINNGAHNLRTPGGSYVRFPGRSLTIIGNGQPKGSRYATLMLKLNSNGSLFVEDLRLRNAVVMQGKAGTPMTVEGGVTLLEGPASVVRANVGTVLNIAATVTGPGALRTGGMGEVVLLAANDYAGGTQVESGTLRAQVAHSLGTGDVVVADDAKLALSSGQALSLGASLLLAPRSSVTLSFSGTLSIARLSFDGGATFVEPGLWGAPGSGADNVHPRLNGIGRIRVRGTGS
mgnify:CR=1 FL=1|jgi:autotransporter-associated beta strand repeat